MNVGALALSQYCALLKKPSNKLFRPSAKILRARTVSASPSTGAAVDWKIIQRFPVIAQERAITVI